MIFTYLCKSGHLTDRNYSMDNAKRTIQCPQCKGKAERDYTRISGFRPPSCWPLHSEAMGVNPDQIPEAVQNAKERGVPTDFDAQGRAIFTDRSHRKKFLQAHQMHDKDGGYGD